MITKKDLQKLLDNVDEEKLRTLTHNSPCSLSLGGIIMDYLQKCQKEKSLEDKLVEAKFAIEHSLISSVTTYSKGEVSVECDKAYIHVYTERCDLRSTRDKVDQIFADIDYLEKRNNNA